MFVSVHIWNIDKRFLSERVFALVEWILSLMLEQCQSKWAESWYSC